MNNDLRLVKLLLLLANRFLLLLWNNNNNNNKNCLLQIHCTPKRKKKFFFTIKNDKEFRRKFKLQYKNRMISDDYRTYIHTHTLKMLPFFCCCYVRIFYTMNAHTHIYIFKMIDINEMKCDVMYIIHKKMTNYVDDDDGDDDDDDNGNYTHKKIFFFDLNTQHATLWMEIIIIQ